MDLLLPFLLLLLLRSISMNTTRRLVVVVVVIISLMMLMAIRGEGEDALSDLIARLGLMVGGDLQR